MLSLLWHLRIPLFFTVFIWTLCLVPPADLEIPAILNGDKIFHFVIFGILNLMTIYALVRQTRYVKLRGQAYWLGVAYCALNGLLIELVQHWAVRNRRGDWLDFASDAAGALILGLLYFPVAGRPVFRFSR